MHGLLDALHVPHLATANSASSTLQQPCYALLLLDAMRVVE
jgi:hypothetical protein